MLHSSGFAFSILAFFSGRGPQGIAHISSTLAPTAGNDADEEPPDDDEELLESSVYMGFSPSKFPMK